MQDQEESSAATATESRSTSSTNWSRVLREVDLESLSPRSQSISLLIGDEMIEGFKLNEIASKLGQPSSWVADRLNELRQEIVLNSGHFLPLTDAEYLSLTESIKEYGVRTPVLIGEHQLIDGRHRWTISQELGLTDIPAVFLFGLSKEQEHDIAVAVNSARRHLNRKQKRAIIRSELQRDWSRSSRQIAAICGVSAPTVEDVRAEMRRESETLEHGAPLPAFVPPKKEEERRVDSSGREQPAYVSDRRPSLQTEKKIGCGICPHGEYVEIFEISGQEELSIRSSRD